MRGHCSESITRLRATPALCLCELGRGPEDRGKTRQANQARPRREYDVGSSGREWTGARVGQYGRYEALV
jgi:hypothetical protein